MGMAQPWLPQLFFYWLPKDYRVNIASVTDLRGSVCRSWKARMKIRLAAIGLTVLMAAGVAKAITITNDINFDNLAGGDVPVTTQYQSEGVTFDAQTLSEADGSLDYLYYPPNSYPIVVAPLDFSYVLASADSGVFTSAGAYVTGYGNTILNAYDSSNNLLATATVDGPNLNYFGTPNQFESVSAPDIAYLTFSNTYGPGFMTVDDFTYTYTGTPPASSSVPLPAPLWGASLLLLGLGGFRAMRAMTPRAVMA
jgi:hypothetical protein